MNETKLVTFDEEIRLRVLDVDKYNSSVSLRDNCGAFAEKVESLKALSTRYVDALENVAVKIEAEKLRAVGLRNKVAALRMERDQHKKHLQRQLLEKEKLLNSLNQEEKSLVAVQDEQETQMSRVKGTAVF